MFTRSLLFQVLAPVALLTAGVVAVQHQDKKETPKQDQAGPAMPKPTKEHAWLKGRVGNWDATVNMMGEKSPASDSVRMFGEFWQVAEFSGLFNGMEFKGIGTMGYDLEKKKFIGSWIDSMSSNMALMEGTLNEAGTVLTMEGDAPNMMGQVVRCAYTTEIKDNDTATFWHFEKAKGKEDPMAMHIDYKRKK